MQCLETQIAPFLRRHQKTIAWGATCALFFILLWHAWHAAFDHDEIEHLHAAWLVGQGLTPFRDFLEQHHQLIWYLLAPITTHIVSPHLIVFAARLLDLAGLGVFLLLFRKAFSILYPTLPAIWPTLLLLSCFSFTRNMLEVRPDPWMNTFFFGGLLFWLLYQQRARWYQALLAGISFGTAIVVLQKAIVLIVLFFAVLMVLVLLRSFSRRRVRDLLAGGLLVATGALLPLALFGLAIAANGSATDFVFWNYTYNRYLYLAAHVAAHFSILKTIRLSFIQCPALWMLGLTGLLFLASNLWKERRSLATPSEGKTMIALIAAGYFLSLAMSRFPFSHYLIVWMPLLALVSGECLLRLGKQGRAWIFKLAAVLMLIALSLILFFYAPNDSQRQVQDRVLKETTEDETVVIAPPHHPIRRHDGAWFWYNGTMLEGVYAEYCALHTCPNDKRELEASLWSTTKPAFVFINPEYPEYRPVRWEERKEEYTETSVAGLFKRKETMERCSDGETSAEARPTSPDETPPLSQARQTHSGRCGGN
jgi:hypothetical protein